MTSFNPDDLILGDDDLQLGGDDLSALGLTVDLGQMDFSGNETSPRHYDADVPTVREIEEESAKEISDVLAGFKQRAATEQQRFDDATDSEYWFCVCFQTREQKDEFLQKVGLYEHGDKYVDGMFFAELLRITLEARVPPMPRPDNTDPRLARLADDRLQGTGIPASDDPYYPDLLDL